MRYLIVLFLLVGCKAQEQLVYTDIEIKDSVVIREVEKEVLVPGFSEQSAQVDLAEIQKMIDKGFSIEEINKVLARSTKEQNARVGILMDELGFLRATCEKQDEIIKVLTKELEIYRTEILKEVYKQEKSFAEKIEEGFSRLVYLIVVILVLYMILTKLALPLILKMFRP